MTKFSSASIFRNTYVILFGIVLFLTACDKDNPPAPEENKYLLTDSLITSITKESIVQTATASDPVLGGFLKLYVKNGVKAYRITYKTKNTDGTEIIASGALILPSTDQPVSMISVQHGTISNDSDAPSYFKSTSEGASFGSLFGSLGYIIAYPDYIGYGASKAYPHPYEHRASLASASLDMLRAAKEFLRGQSEVKWDEKLYVAGYSEGGYATMSLQKKIEEEASAEFNLKASSCGAGAYDKTAFMKHVINNTTLGVAAYNKLYLWVMLTYDRLYKLNKPASYYFQEPYAAGITSSSVNYPIAKSFNLVLNDSFKKLLNDGADTGFINAIADNDVYNWKPKTPTRLFHGNEDPLVFYFNSVNAYTAMKKLGAADVELITVDKGTHSSSINSFLLGTLAFFQDSKYK